MAVAVGNVDSFVSFPGAGAESAGTYVMVVGTSICDMVVHPSEVALTGITGVAKDGILPGLYGYEAGQPAAGDILGWFGDMLFLGTPGYQRNWNRPPEKSAPAKPAWSLWTGGTATAVSWPTPI